MTLNEIAKKMCAKGKGILAADESTGTITKRFDSINLNSSFENRRKYRELLFKTHDLNKFISGIILFDETIRQSTSDGIPFSEFLKNLPRVGGEQSLLSKAGDIGSQVAGAIMPGFSDYDPLTGQFKEFNFEKALLTVGVATTLGGLKAIAEKIKKEKDMSEAEEKAIWKEWFDSYERRAGKPYSETNYPDDFLMEKYDRYMLASGGRVGYNMGGLSGGIMASSGVPQGMQVDGRNGAFIPMGVEEKADDVPAMLSKNEFVMTADAVKAAGDGDANKGAQRMYDLMHSLEAQV